MMMDIGETPDFVLKWLDENTPSEYRDHEDLERAFDRLSRADISWEGCSVASTMGSGHMPPTIWL